MAVSISHSLPILTVSSPLSISGTSQGRQPSVLYLLSSLCHPFLCITITLSEWLTPIPSSDIASDACLVHLLSLILIRFRFHFNSSFSVCWTNGFMRVSYSLVTASLIQFFLVRCLCENIIAALWPLTIMLLIVLSWIVKLSDAHINVDVCARVSVPSICFIGLILCI